MNKQALIRGHTLIFAAVAALAPLAAASAGSNPETGAFYDFGAQVRGAPGPIRSDEPSPTWQATNPELGAFYRAQDFGPAPQRGDKGPIGSDDPSGMAGGAAHPRNPETGAFYNLSAAL
jgi:hypothetical protein